jgi:AcrR family transcriptional regulator
MKSLSTPKRRDAAKTSSRILSAAKLAFSRHGYTNASIREIAALADVNSALVARYFGSKAGLFEAALLDNLPIYQPPDGDRRHFGYWVATKILEEDVDIVFPVASLLSIADDDAKNIGKKVFQEHVIPPLAKWLGPPNAETRAVNIFILCCGFALFSKQMPSGDRRLQMKSATLEWFIKSVQDLADQSS